MAFRLFPERKEIGRAVLRVALLLVTILALGVGWCSQYTMMPGYSYSAEGASEAVAGEEVIRGARLRKDIEALAALGPKELVHNPEGLEKAKSYLVNSLRAVAGTDPERVRIELETYSVGKANASNIVVTLPGQGPDKEEIVVVGAHYDTAHDCPGANDNGSGVAALLELYRLFVKSTQNKPLNRTLRLVFFANEEPPWFATEQMGSAVHANNAKKRGDKIVAMYSLETIGYFTDAPGSQNYPPPFSLLYPDQGNFLAFVGTDDSSALVKRSIKTFRDKKIPLPSEGIAAPSWVNGIDFSDHRNFVAQGYPALMVTDTAMFRYPYYHKTGDTPDKLNYPALATVVRGLRDVVGAEIDR